MQAGAIVTGLDAAADVIECAKLHAKTSEIFSDNLNYVCDTIENFCEKNIEQYDAVVASETIEHVTAPDLFLKSCVKTLKVDIKQTYKRMTMTVFLQPGGSIFITTINKTIWSWLKAIILYEYITDTIPRGTHEWNKFISPEEIGDILKQCKSVR